jgi:hypothetical protein
VIGIISFVGEDGFGLDKSRERFSLRDVVNLAAVKLIASGLPRASTMA